MKPTEEFWDGIWDLCEKYDIPVTNSPEVTRKHPGIAHIADFGKDVLALLEALGMKAEWGIRFEADDLSPLMNNGSGVSTHTKAVGTEWQARQCVETRAPISARDRRVVSRIVSNWVEES
ncbi:hypothetical protein [Nocardia jiangxiensis]|uniref:hypothetical protein n=1 Tax=Nocardia jiangxiensis TaxID=282685 RepID=UPI000593F90E|nr:hypothetical protein [Nocardia jiangxiensis]